MKVSRMATFLKYRKLITIGIIITGLLSLAFGIVTFYAENTGNYIIALEKNDSRSMSLSETFDFADSKDRLYAASIKNMSNIDGRYIDEEAVASVDGSNNKSGSYLAYTFYLKNVGSEIYDYRMNINITAVKGGIDSALRVRVIRGDEPSVTYAKVQEQGQIGEPEPGTLPFVSQYVVVDEIVANFRISEIHKYTVIIYIEGNDPECKDDILSSSIKMEMHFEVIGL